MDNFENLLKRLENAVSKLETVNSSSVGIQNKSIDSNVKFDPLDKKVYKEFWESAKRSMNLMIENSKNSELHEHLNKLNEIAIKSILIHQILLDSQADYVCPDQKILENYQKHFMDLIKEISVIKNEKKVESHCEAILYGINSLLWITLKSDCADVVQEYSSMIDTHRNKIFLKKIDVETNWIKAWREIFTNLLKLVKTEYKFGLIWNVKGKNDFENLNIFKYVEHYNNNKNLEIYKQDDKIYNETEPNKVNLTSDIKLVKKPYHEFIENSENIFKKMFDYAKSSNYSENLVKITKISKSSFKIQQILLENQSNYSLPSSDQFKKIQNFFTEKIKEISKISQEVRELEHHCSALTIGISALFWVTLNDGCVDVVQQYSDMIDTYRNKIFMKKIESETGWVKSWKELFPLLIKLVKEEYKFGLIWNPNSKNNFDDVVNLISSESLPSNSFFTFKENKISKVENIVKNGDEIVLSNINGSVKLPNSISTIILEECEKLSIFSNNSTLYFEVNECKNLKEITINGVSLSIL